MVSTTGLIETGSADNQRIGSLIEWSGRQLGGSIDEIDFASEDASFRRYFRVRHGNATYIVMDAPVEHLDTEPFVRIARRLRQAGLNAPEIHAWNPGQGFVLMTDFGHTTYLGNLSNKTADTLYEDAINALIQIQLITTATPDFLPPYDAGLLHQEMQLFQDWYLPKHRKIPDNSEISAILHETFEILCAKALEQPTTWVHLDYHSRNLMVVDENNPGILDFQDAVVGPVTYDLVSLLRDCYIVWPPQRIRGWIQLYLQNSRLAGLPIGDDKQFMQWFDWMGLQRHLKVAGIFSRLYYRDGKSKFLDDIPTVMRYIESVSSRYSELRPLHQLVLRLNSDASEWML